MSRKRRKSQRRNDDGRFASVRRSLPFMAVPTFGVALFCDLRRFSDRPLAALYTIALTTLLVRQEKL